MVDLELKIFLVNTTKNKHRNLFIYTILTKKLYIKSYN